MVGRFDGLVFQASPARSLDDLQLDPGPLPSRVRRGFLVELVLLEKQQSADDVFGSVSQWLCDQQLAAAAGKSFSVKWQRARRKQLQTNLAKTFQAFESLERLEPHLYKPRAMRMLNAEYALLGDVQNGTWYVQIEQVATQLMWALLAIVLGALLIAILVLLWTIASQRPTLNLDVLLKS